MADLAQQGLCARAVVLAPEDGTLRGAAGGGLAAVEAAQHLLDLAGAVGAEVAVGVDNDALAAGDGAIEDRVPGGDGDAVVAALKD